MKIISRFFLFSLVLFSQATAIVGHGNFSNLSFTAAFDSLYINFSTCYPFTDWKAINWHSLYNEYYPQILAAQNGNDISAYKLAVRRFIHSFPDGHVRVRGDFQDLFWREIGGGFGLTIIELDDGSIVVNRVLPGSPAEQQGLEVGANLIEWNGLPIKEALQNTDIIWEGKPPANHEATGLAQLRRLIRVPVGTQIDVTFSNPDQGAVKKTLMAVDDGMETWNLTHYTKFTTNGSVNLTPDDVLNPVQYKILDSGYGYLKNRILVEFDSRGNLLPTYDNIYHLIKEAIDYFNAARVPAVIVDIRDNPGGFDRLAALFGSFFYDHTALYEYASFYHPETGQFKIIESFTIYLAPQQSYYGGPVLCLVNAGTSSSAEGVAMAIQRLSHGHVLGFYGTHGSFALTSGETLMPGGLAVCYPLGRSLDEMFAIQIDSDSTKNGGVMPDLRVPMSRENMHAMYVDHDDVELNYAIDYLNSMSAIIENPRFQPGAVQLFPNYPNPFNAQTIIPYFLSKPMPVRLSIYNLTGQVITTLVDDYQQAGDYTTLWNGIDSQGKDVGSGVYFYKLTAGDNIEIHKMILVR